MYLIVIGSCDHSWWFVCIFGREIQTSCYKCCLLRAVLVWTQMKLQQKQEVISDFPKKSKKYFNTRGGKSISPRVRNPSKEWRRKTHEKKLKERYLSHSYVFNLFKSSRYVWLHFLLYALSWPQAASLPRTPSIPDETIHEHSWQGLCSSSLQKLGFEQILASLSSFNHKCCWCASKWFNSMSRYRQ